MDCLYNSVHLSQETGSKEKDHRQNKGADSRQLQGNGWVNSL